MTQPLFKPRDLVRTPHGRTARVVEVLTAGRRLVQFIDGPREQAIVQRDDLLLVREAPVVGFQGGVWA